ncbi:MAG TPA: IS4 family transposase [Candidatus Sulfotelmatobacter sp.]|nr:IS4 family transposase [Candidatus Sulfotelmatobacter sp.]
MTRVSSIFSQMLQLFSRTEFEQAVREHRAEWHARGFSCWGQFVAMLFCHLGRAQSLREICGGLAASEGKLRHLGLPDAPKRSTLAYANEHRPWQLYRSVFYQLLSRCREVAGTHGFRFKNKLLTLDATLIELCASVFDWAQYRRTKGAVKLHLLLDHQGLLPSFALVTEGRVHESRVARRLRFEPGTIVVFDRGYADYDWFAALDAQGVFFVTRLKENADYGVVERRPVPAGSAVRRDEIIFLYKAARDGNLDLFLRRIEVWDEEQKRVLVFLTNHRGFAASTIAAIYRQRWQIELFFKALKQNLRIKTFVGTSPNALHIQIWTALIALLLLKYLQLRARFGWSLSNLTALLRQQLFVYRDLFAWIDEPFQPPPLLDPAAEQLALSW